ncbi:patatin-like phospholipase family protein [Mangrovivirga cuniculi]|uniref:PNPLA domain-containing protein n=1 Tax=Mangrovivirga cuniculi TaxID=2715131 RepID=A0A4D7JTA6_9BACT|nr:patatin-like phospholipase family protein [Mangrovivirga cuniculi]QCK16750.1 hypothetical protein DCC35_19440 [Mangrovivirga cuniculi]
MVLKSIKPFSLILIFLFLHLNLLSQENRPKIGLVLSGGGAKGIAHIGVLKAMEEAGLTPDYITGTSMGSIIGGLYSIGYSADELAEIAKTADWEYLLSNKIPLDRVTFEEKFYYGRYLLEFYYQDKKIVTPRGIIEGQALLDYFSYLTRPVHDLRNFDEFPIPFKCVATDIETGEPVVLDKGSLAMAMRASMAIPSIFTPVTIDDKLLVDGGLVRNMPVDEVLDMGADIIIGVFVSSDLDPAENLNSPLAILSQATFIKSAFDSRKQMDKCDILISPDLKEFSTGSFSSAQGILEQGNKAGNDYKKVFKNLADSLKKIEPLNKIDKPKISDEYIISKIIVKGNKVIPDEYIIGKMRIDPGEIVSINKIEEQISIIYGTQYFERIWYEINKNDSTYSLHIDVVERPKVQFRFAYHYDTENSGGVVINTTLRNLLLNKSRLIFEANLATQPSYLMDYFKYLGEKQKVAFRARGLHSRNDLPLYDEEGNVNNEFRHRYSIIGINFQSTIKRNSTYGFGIEWTHTDLTPEIVQENVEFLTKVVYNNARLRLFYRYNNLNKRYFPSEGIKLDIIASTTVGSNGTFTLGDTLEIDENNESIEIIQTSAINTLEVNVDPIIPLNDKISIINQNRLRISTQETGFFNFSEYDFVGGFTPAIINSYQYWGGGIKEFYLANYFYSKVGIQYEVKNNLFLTAIINYLDTENPMKWIYPNVDTGLAGDRSSRFGYGMKIGYMSPVGPFAFAFAKDHYRKGWQTSLIIGFHY